MMAWARGLLVIALLLAGFALKNALVMPPAAESRPAPGQFDTGRAFARLQRILGDQRPHPVDSAGDDAVRDRLVAELRAVGLEPRIQDAMDCSEIPKTRFVSCSHLRNVIAMVPSKGPGQVVLLNAHYDSTPTGPGAGDDGLGVATLLEVGYLLKQSPPQRPVALLFNEGEEFGLNGAHAFVRADPLAKSVNSLINIDNRGVTGPALMHETSDPNGAALRIYAGATGRSYANSVSTDFAKLIPNTTDVLFFKPAGWTLLNYGIIGNETRYHSPGDTTAALDRDSLADVGKAVLAATRAMAATPDPARAASGQIVFTDLAGRMLLRLPLAIAAAALGLLLVLGLLLGWRQKALGKPLLIAAGMALGGIVTAAVAGAILSILRPGDFWRAYPLVAYLALYAMLLLGMAAIYARWGRDIERSRRRAAAWLLVLVVGAVASLALPGATIFFLIAPALGLLAAWLTGRRPRTATAIAMVAVIVQFLMFAQMLAFVEMLLIDGPIAAVGPLAALAALPAIVEAEPSEYRFAMRPLALLSAMLCLASLVMPRASAERPLGFSIDYYRDVGDRAGNWAIATKQAPLPADYPGKWHQGVLPYNSRTRWIAPAPLLATPAPAMRVIADQPAGAGRKLILQLSPGGGNGISIRFAAEAKVQALGLPGAAIPIPAAGEPDKALLRCTGRSCDGLRIEVLLGDRRPVAAELFSTRFGLPPEGRKLQVARPADAQPQYSPDETITRSTIRL
jgi:hypothetical protein